MPDVELVCSANGDLAVLGHDTSSMLTLTSNRMRGDKPLASPAGRVWYALGQLERTYRSAHHLGFVGARDPDFQ